MVSHWDDREQVRTGINSAGLLIHVCWLLGIFFAVVGIIGDAADFKYHKIVIYYSGVK